MNILSTALLTAFLAAIAVPSTASAVPLPSISITEVAPWGSASSYLADWFELTNTGASSVDITGWKMDDNSNLFANSVALRGVTSIAAGQSVVFLEGTATGTTDATINANFLSSWFGSNVPAGVTLGNYGGAGVGLSATADAVNIYNAAGTLISNVSFGASASNVSFDNSAGLTGAITQLSVLNTNGAITSFDGLQTGSPASIAAVPEPEQLALMLAGLGLIGATLRRKTLTSAA